jgi:hypothetical protein
MTIEERKEDIRRICYLINKSDPESLDFDFLVEKFYKLIYGDLGEVS